MSSSRPDAARSASDAVVAVESQEHTKPTADGVATQPEELSPGKADKPNWHTIQVAEDGEEVTSEQPVSAGPRSVCTLPIKIEASFAQLRDGDEDMAVDVDTMQLPQSEAVLVLVKMLQQEREKCCELERTMADVLRTERENTALLRAVNDTLRAENRQLAFENLNLRKNSSLGSL